MTAFVKVIKMISRALVYVCYAAVIVLAGMTVWDVIMRYVFGRPNSGVTEYSQMLLIICMTAMAHALVEGRFIAVGTIVDRFPKKLNITVEIVMGVISFAFFVVVGWQLIKMAETSMIMREAYFVVKTPRWPMYMILGISFLASGLATIAYVIERVTNFVAPQDKSVFDDNPDLAILALDEEKPNKGEGGMQ